MLLTMTPKKTILLVEDNPDDIELTLLAFERSRLDPHIAIARDGIEALNYLFGRGNLSLESDCAPLPDLVLMDIKLPKVDGLEVLRQMRSHQRTKSIPVVVLTTSTEPHDLLRSYTIGCNSYVLKSVDFDRFHRVVEQLGTYWLEINEAPLRLGV